MAEMDYTRSSKTLPETRARERRGRRRRGGGVEDEPAVRGVTWVDVCEPQLRALGQGSCGTDQASLRAIVLGNSLGLITSNWPVEDNAE